MDAKKYIQIMCGVFIVALAVYGWHCISLGRGSVHCDKNGAAAVGNKLDEAGSHQQGAAERIEAAEKYAQSSKIRLGGVESSADRIQAGTESSAELIRECQSVIKGIHQRGKIQTPTN